MAQCVYENTKTLGSTIYRSCMGVTGKDVEIELGVSSVTIAIEAPKKVLNMVLPMVIEDAKDEKEKVRGSDSKGVAHQS